MDELETLRLWANDFAKSQFRCGYEQGVQDAVRTTPEYVELAKYKEEVNLLRKELEDARKRYGGEVEGLARELCKQVDRMRECERNETADRVTLKTVKRMITALDYNDAEAALVLARAIYNTLRPYINDDDDEVW